MGHNIGKYMAAIGFQWQQVSKQLKNKIWDLFPDGVGIEKSFSYCPV